MRRVQRGREEGDATSQGAFPAPHSFRAYGDAGGGSGGVPEFGNNYGIGNSNGVGDGAHNFGSGNGSETNGYSYGYPEFSRIGHYRDAEASSFVTALSSHGSDAFGTAGASNSHANEFGFGHRPASPQFKFETFHLDDVGPLFGAKAKLVKEEVKEPVQGPFSVPDSSDRSGSDAPVAVTVKDVPDPDAKPAISKPGASSHDKAKPNLSVKVKAEDGKPDVAPRPVPKRFPWDDALATTTDTKPDTKPDTGPIAPPRSKTPSAEFDADDAWISAAVAQVTKVEGT
jgi:hypothetical protein